MSVDASFSEVFPISDTSDTSANDLQNSFPNNLLPNYAKRFIRDNLFKRQQQQQQPSEDDMKKNDTTSDVDKCRIFLQFCIDYANFWSYYCSPSVQFGASQKRHADFYKKLEIFVRESLGRGVLGLKDPLLGCEKFGKVAGKKVSGKQSEREKKGDMIENDILVHESITEEKFFWRTLATFVENKLLSQLQFQNLNFLEFHRALECLVIFLDQQVRNAKSIGSTDLAEEIYKRINGIVKEILCSLFGFDQGTNEGKNDERTFLFSPTISSVVHASWIAIAVRHNFGCEKSQIILEEQRRVLEEMKVAGEDVDKRLSEDFFTLINALLDVNEKIYTKGASIIARERDLKFVEQAVKEMKPKVVVEGRRNQYEHQYDRFSARGRNQYDRQFGRFSAPIHPEHVSSLAELCQSWYLSDVDLGHPRYLSLPAYEKYDWMLSDLAFNLRCSWSVDYQELVKTSGVMKTSTKAIKEFPENYGNNVDNWIHQTMETDNWQRITSRVPRNILLKNTTFILSFSGGVDSTALLAICADLKKTDQRFDFCCLYLKYPNRGEQAEREYDWVKYVCELFDARLYVFEVDLLRPHGDSPGEGDGGGGSGEGEGGNNQANNGKDQKVEQKVEVSGAEGADGTGATGTDIKDRFFPIKDTSKWFNEIPIFMKKDAFTDTSNNNKESVVKVPVKVPGLTREEYERETKRIRLKMYDRVAEMQGASSPLSVILVGHHADDCDENRCEQLASGHLLGDLRGMNRVALTDTTDTKGAATEEGEEATDDKENGGYNRTEKSKNSKTVIWRPFLHRRKADFLNLLNTGKIPYAIDSTPKWSVRGRLREILEKVVGVDGDSNFVSNLDVFCKTVTEYWGNFSEGVLGNNKNDKKRKRSLKKTEQGPILIHLKPTRILRQTIKIIPSHDGELCLFSRHQYLLKKTGAVVDLFTIDLSVLQALGEEPEAKKLKQMLFGDKQTDSLSAEQKEENSSYVQTSPERNFSTRVSSPKTSLKNSSETSAETSWKTVTLPDMRTLWNKICKTLNETELSWPEHENVSLDGLLFERVLMEICRNYIDSDSTNADPSSSSKKGHYHFQDKCATTRKAIKHVWNNINNARTSGSGVGGKLSGNSGNKSDSGGVSGGGFTERLGYLYFSNDFIEENKRIGTKQNVEVDPNGDDENTTDENTIVENKRGQLVLYEIRNGNIAGNSSTGANGRVSMGAKDLRANIVEKFVQILNGEDEHGHQEEDSDVGDAAEDLDEDSED